MSPLPSKGIHRGDDGLTDLIHGPRVSKASRPVQALGEIDELNSLIGVIRSFLDAGPIAISLIAIQQDLFLLGEAVATLPSASNQETHLLEKITRLENEIQALEGQIPPIQSFLLPGGSQASALLQYARTVCRRAERSVVCLLEEARIFSPLQLYLNRLSDLLFLQARAVNLQAGSPEILWKPPAPHA
jgi:cob(I)alamin adenosyltransferase